MIFRRYLELGSVRALMQELDRQGHRTKRQVLTTGRTRGGIRFGVGSLSHLLRNRFYIGEVAYRGTIHPGEQEPILDRSTFEAAQAKLNASAVERRVRIKDLPAILTGRIFDDRGNRMTPTHTNKQGVRYRYYVSHAILQKQDAKAGSVPRVPAHEIEALVVDAVKGQSSNHNKDGIQDQLNDRERIEQRIERIIVKP